MLHGRASYTYNFRVLQENSNWGIYAPDGSKATPAYSGTIWIDKRTNNIMRIEEESGPMPSLSLPARYGTHCSGFGSACPTRYTRRKYSG